MNEFAEIVTHRLEEKGLGPGEIEGFVRCVVLTISDDNHIGLEKLNRRLGWLGWDTVDLDYQTLQLIIASFEAEDLVGRGYTPFQWFEHTYNPSQYGLQGRQE